MHRFQDILLTLVGAGVTSQERRPIEDLDVEGIGFDHHILSRSVDRHRVAVGFVDNHAVAVEPGACGGTTIVGEGRQAA